MRSISEISIPETVLEPTEPTGVEHMPRLPSVEIGSVQHIPSICTARSQTQSPLSSPLTIVPSPGDSVL